MFYPNDNLTVHLDNKGSYFYDFYWKKNEKPYLVKNGSEYVLNPDLMAFYDAIPSLLLSRIKSYNQQASVNLSSQKQFTSDEVHDIVTKNVSFFNLFTLDNFKLGRVLYLYELFKVNKQSVLPFSSRLAIDELEKICSQSCNAFVVYIPNSTLWRPDARANSFRSKLKEYSLSKNIPFIDTTEKLRMLSDSEAYSIKGPHLSPKGYQIVSSLISNVINY